jgi:hypothetical protein
LQIGFAKVELVWSAIGDHFSTRRLHDLSGNCDDVSKAGVVNAHVSVPLAVGNLEPVEGKPFRNQPFKVLTVDNGVGPAFQGDECAVTVS